MSRYPDRASVATLVALTALIGLLSGCSSDGSTSKPRTSTSTRPNARVEVTVGTVNVPTAGAPVALADADRDAIVTAIGAYIDAATLAPLTKAVKDPDAALAPLLVASAAPALTGPERDALVDSGIGQATGAVKTTFAPVNLTGLADQFGAIDLVGTTFDLTVNTTAKRGVITIHRTGELMFTRDGDTWKIFSFRLAVTREGDGIETPTASTSSTTGSAAP